MRRLTTLATLVAGALAPLTAVQASMTRGAEQILELCSNGSFEEELAIGWQVTLPDTGSVITRDVGLEPDPDFEVLVAKDGVTGVAGLDQVLPLHDLDMRFSLRARMLADAGYVSWAAAGVMLTYIDEGGFTLGQTAICAVSRSCPWENGPSFHLIEPWHGDWEAYSFRLADEVAANLPGVDPSAVHTLRISVQAILDDC